MLFQAVSLLTSNDMIPTDSLKKGKGMQHNIPRYLIYTSYLGTSLYKTRLSHVKFVLNMLSVGEMSRFVNQFLTFISFKQKSGHNCFGHMTRCRSKVSN
jgi:hypothetical protein